MLGNTSQGVMLLTVKVHACMQTRLESTEWSLAQALLRLGMRMGAQVWLGYTQSLRPTQSGLTLNMDMAATAFLEVQPVVNFLLRAANFRSPAQFAGAPPPKAMRDATRAIAGLKARMLAP